MDRTAKILQISVGGNEFTGIASFLLQYYRGIDRSKVRFDFLFCKQNSMTMIMDDPIFADSEFYVLNATKKNSNEMDYFSLSKKLASVLKKEKYDAVHVNTTAVGAMLCCLLTARLCGVKTVIAHSHNTKVTLPRGTRKRNPLLQKTIDIIKGFCPWLIRSVSDALFACSEPAGRSLFGEKGVRNKKFYVIRNAISAEKYRVSAAIREEVRREYSVPDTAVVVGHIGRFAPEKNHLFLVDVFGGLLKRLPEAELWLIGQGEEYDAVSEAVKNLGIDSSVRFLGQKNDVHRYLQAMDIFIFPSLSEGLGMVAIESQAAGLPTYASDAVPEATRVTDVISYLPLASGAEAWSDIIVNEHKWTQSKSDTYNDIVKSGYDMTQSAQWLQNFYLSCKE